MLLKLKTKSQEFSTESIDISFGVLEDIINTLDFESLTDNRQIGLALLKCSKQIKPIIKELFPDASDEDIRSVKTSNLIEIFKGIYIFATEELGKVSDATKN